MIDENQEPEASEVSEIEEGEVEDPEEGEEVLEETTCFSLIGQTAENISMIGETFNKSPQTIIELAVNNPGKYSTMLETARKLTE